MVETNTVAVIDSDTEVGSVTFFEDRAEVTRLARVTVPAGRSRIHARGITLLVDDRSLVCKTADNAEIVFSRVRRTVEDIAQASAADIAKLEDEQLEAAERVARAERAIIAAKADGDRTATLLALWAQNVSSVPSRAGDATEELDRAYTAIDVERTKQIELNAAQQQERRAAKEGQRWADARAELAREKKPRYEAFAEIEVTAKEAGAITIELVYRTPCAVWRPEHLARLKRNDDGSAGEITITTYATVWQMTGEDWKDVRCRFSTARPAREASAPLLKEDVLTTRKKSSDERSRVVVEARDQAIVTAGARGTKDIEEMPGVDDGGETQWLTGRALATIASDGHPVRVEVGDRTIACSVARVCFPELGIATHLRANGTLPGPGPLLAGPVTIGREQEIVGKSKTEFVGAGEPFELGFGVDDGLRVRRKVIEKRTTTAITGTQHIEREVWLYVSNLSNGPKKLAITERVPVSEIEDLSVEVQPEKGMKFDSRDGFATFDVEIAPHATKELTLAYKLEAKSNVVLPAL